MRYLAQMGAAVSRKWELPSHGFGKKCVARIWKINTRSNAIKASHGFGKEVEVPGECGFDGRKTGLVSHADGIPLCGFVVFFIEKNISSYLHGSYYFNKC